MDDRFALSPFSFSQQQARQALMDCNRLSERFGLSLSPAQVECLVSRCGEALRETGRVELGQSVLAQLVHAFCDSAYITQADWLETLMELVDSFYDFKNESMDQIPDDELIAFMREKFEHVCHGDITSLRDITLGELCRGTRYGQENRTDDDF